MKIRNGFVTNSSSSSFIIAFQNEDEIESSVRKAILEYPPTHCIWGEMTIEDVISGATHYALNGIAKGKTSLEEIEKILTREFKAQARWALYYNTKIFLEDDGSYLNSKEYKTKEKEFVGNRVKEVMEKLKGKDYIFYASFSDNDGCIGSYIEHEIAPNMKETVCVFSHH